MEIAAKVEEKPAASAPPSEPAADDEKKADEQPAEAKDTEASDDAKEKASGKKRQTVAVTIKSDPLGSRVSTGRHVFGTTPLTLKLRPGNTYDLTFTKAGYTPLSRKVHFEKEEPQTVKVTLKKQPEPPKPPPPPPKPAPPPQKKSWFGR